MVNIVRLEMPRAGDDRRWLVGLSVGSRCQEIAAALIAVRGRGLQCEIDVVACHVRPAPRETLPLFHQLGTHGGPPSLEAIVELRAMLAQGQAAAVAELLGSVNLPSARVLAAGVCDPGWWKVAPPAPSVYASLCDPARLAELTGLSVLDAFPARDVAQGGQGGPLAALGQWLMLRDSARDRILLDLGRTTRLSYLPAANADRAVDAVVSFEVGPGTALLDQLTHRFTGGQQHFDPGGRLAVQGRRIPELIDHWLGDPYFDRALPRWHPRGVRPERFLADAIELAKRHGWSVRDLLCTATHLIAETAGRAVARRLPEATRPTEIIVSGGGQHNGLLLRETGECVPHPLLRLGEMLPPDALEPACAAVLAMCHLDQTPGNLPACTGAELPRLLGRLTPGAPQNWQRVLHTMAHGVSTARPLRAAL